MHFTTIFQKYALDLDSESFIDMTLFLLFIYIKSPCPVIAGSGQYYFCALSQKNIAALVSTLTLEDTVDWELLALF